MSRVTRFILAVVALLGVTAPLAAQTTSPQSVNLTAKFTIIPMLACVRVSDITYGPGFAGGGPINMGGAIFAELTCTTDPNNNVSVSFVLPSTLVSGTNTMPISYGTTSAHIIDVGGATAARSFNPATGTTAYKVTSGNLDLTLGKANAGGATDFVTMDPTGKPAGVYTGTITVTITVP